MRKVLLRIIMVKNGGNIPNGGKVTRYNKNRATAIRDGPM